jgi:branched-chain amino acid transport system substrate-binding protein
MNKSNHKAISTVAVVVVVIILIVAITVGVYFATVSTSTKTTTSTTSSSSQMTTTSSSTSLTSSSTTPVSATCNVSQLTFCFPVIAKPANATLSNNASVTIGVLTDETSQLSSIGIRIGDAAQVAASAVNAWIAANDSSWAGSVHFNAVVDNYALNTQMALSDLSSFQTSGVSVIVGPLDSGTTGNVYSTAASDNIVLISPSSTAVTLAGISPYLFRTVPNDAFQGLADAREMYQDGVRHVIIVYIDTAYGSGLANATSARFTQIGGSVTAMVPYASTTTDFTTTLAQLNTEWSDAVSAAGGNASQVAIQAIGYQEVGTMLLQAQSSYPQLLNTTQPWYGTDGESDSSAFTNSTFSTVSADVRLPSTFYSPTNTTATNLVCSQINAMSHTGCDPYSLGAYDDFWLAAESILHCGTSSGSCISKVLPSIANASVGVTGPETLGSNHDRVAFAYDIFAIATVSGSVMWILAGNWTTNADVVTWTSPPKY